MGLPGTPDCALSTPIRLVGLCEAPQAPIVDRDQLGGSSEAGVRSDVRASGGPGRAHKAQVTAAVRVPDDEGGRLQDVAEFKTTVYGLLALRDWLKAHRVTHVAMEATGVY